MMKHCEIPFMGKLFKIISIFALTFGLVYAEPISQEGEKDGYTIELVSENSLVVGENNFYVILKKDGALVNDAKVKAKFFMPEMPGMPYMESLEKAKLVDGKFKFMINFPMGGTWQYHLMFKTADGKVHKVRSSVNL